MDINEMIQRIQKMQRSLEQNERFLTDDMKRQMKTEIRRLRLLIQSKK